MVLDVQRVTGRVATAPLDVIAGFGNFDARSLPSETAKLAVENQKPQLDRPFRMQISFSLVSIRRRVRMTSALVDR
jgi:hypothetical protein